MFKNVCCRVSGLVRRGGRVKKKDVKNYLYLFIILNKKLSFEFSLGNCFTMMACQILKTSIVRDLGQYRRVLVEGHCA